MKKSLITIVVILAVSAAIFSGADILISLSSKTDVQKEEDDELLNSDEPVDIALPDFSKPEPEATIIAVGDIMLSRSVEQLMIKKNDFTLPFLPIANITKNADITLGNLETAILPGRAIAESEFSFRSDPKVVAGLKLAGFDLLTLANNHTPNFGQQGLTSTFDELKQAGIEFVGAGSNKSEAQKPVIMEKSGIKFGFLAYVYPNLPQSYEAKENQAGVNFMDIDKVKSDVSNLKPQVDFVIVLMHAGTEYSAQPNALQIDFAQAAIDAGASLVIGHHPHVVQNFEKYQNGYIIYSLGNFIFDQLWSKEAQQGLMVQASFSKAEIRDIEFIPIKINSSFQPEVATSDIAHDILGRLQTSLLVQPRFYWSGDEYLETNRFEFKLNNSLIQNQTYQAADLDNDNVFEEAVVVQGAGYLIKENKVLWKSEPGWQIENVLIGDFNNDNKLEVGFSLWKQGSYGPDLPVWEKENDKEISNHLFLYQLENDSLKMIWGSSALDYPIKQMNLADLDHNGKNELIVLQSHNQKEIEPVSSLGIWRWNEWNFVNLFKSRQGKFFDLETNLNYINIKEKK